jgi:hypothetical protein
MKEKKFDNFIVFSSIVFVVLMIFHNYYIKRQIFLNSYVPFFIFFTGSTTGLIVIYFIRKALFNIEENIINFFLDFVVMAKSIFLAVLIFGNLSSWFFDYLNMKSTKNVEIVFQKCRVYKISLSSAAGTHNSINFEFMGKNKSINNFTSTELMRTAYKNGGYDSFYLQLSFKKGLLTSYVIEDYSFLTK